MYQIEIWRRICGDHKQFWRGSKNPPQHSFNGNHGFKKYNFDEGWCQHYPPARPRGPALS